MKGAQANDPWEAYHRGHHRAPGEPVLRDGHPGVHHHPRQGRRVDVEGHLHDRRQGGICQGRREEPSARMRHPPYRRHLGGAGGCPALRTDGSVCGDREERLQPEHPALHRAGGQGSTSGYRRTPQGRDPGDRRGGLPGGALQASAEGGCEAQRPRRSTRRCIATGSNTSTIRRTR